MPWNMQILVQIAVSTHSRRDTWCGQLRGSVGGRDCLITVVSLLRAWTNYCLLVCAQMSSGVPASRPRRPAVLRHGTVTLEGSSGPWSRAALA